MRLNIFYFIILFLFCTTISADPICPSLNSIEAALPQGDFDFHNWHQVSISFGKEFDSKWWTGTVLLKDNYYPNILDIPHSLEKAHEMFKTANPNPTAVYRTNEWGAFIGFRVLI